jgi:hypothetical protein
MIGLLGRDSVEVIEQSDDGEKAHDKSADGRRGRAA